MPLPARIATRRGRRVFLFAAATLILSGMAASWFAAHDAALGRLVSEATAAAQSRVQALDGILAQQRAVVAILADDDAVQAALLRGGNDHEAVSRKLDRLRAETSGAVIYLLDRSGTAIAASNWDEPVSFVGSGYAYRSYFTDAMRDGLALQFALGSVSHRPGLYLSHDVRDGERLLGVAVVKVEFDRLEAAWAASPDQSWVTDADGMVVISSDPGARFTPLPAMPGGLIPITIPAPPPGWHLIHAVRATPALRAGAAAAGLAGTMLLLAALGLDRLLRSHLRVRARIDAETQRRAELEAAVAERTRELRDEMGERQRAEQRLAGMQADLVQANKLATLGQVTAGLAHEVNQPLATIRLLAENAHALLPPQASADVTDNLSTIVRMSERIGQITTELRSFSRKATGDVRAVSLREVIEASLLLTASRRRAEGARIVMDDIPAGLTVQVEAVRLEQVLVNLIQNAQEALAGCPDPQIAIGLRERDEMLEISVSDNGPGLAPGIAAHLFTPFTTSKPDGLGLGLVIAQGIIRDFGGELRADLPADPPTALPADRPVPGQGATFRIELPRGGE